MPRIPDVLTTRLAKIGGLAFLGALLLWQAEAFVDRQYKSAIVSAFPADPDASALAALKERYAGNRIDWPQPVVHADAAVKEMEALPLPAKPEGTQVLKVELGRQLFEDPALSASGQISCQSCHNRELGWGDGLRTAFGHGRQKGKRNTPALFNAAWRPELFWDGRAETLEQQAVMPMTDPKEMAVEDLDQVVGRMAGDTDYRKRFRDAFGDEAISLERITEALAAFQATLEERTVFDRFLAGNSAALSDEQVWGLHLFRTKAGCMNCHSGPLLTDDKYHNLGLSLLGRPLADTGRYAISQDMEDVGRFRTPSLRHVRETRPYMHNGLIRELPLVVRFYEVGAGKTQPRTEAEAADPLMVHAGKTSELITPFTLTARERQALVSFLEAL